MSSGSARTLPGSWRWPALLIFRPGAARLALAIPWMASHRSGRDDVRGAIRDVIELPGWAVIDLAELVALARGSIRNRTLLL